MLSQLIAGSTHGWLQVALLVALLAVLIFKPENIQRPKYFWKACMLFVLSLFLPAVLSLFAGEINAEALLGGGAKGLWQKILGLIPAALFALSVFLTLYSLFPTTDPNACWPFAGGKAEKRRTSSKSRTSTKSEPEE